MVADTLPCLSEITPSRSRAGGAKRNARPAHGTDASVVLHHTTAVPSAALTQEQEVVLPQPVGRGREMLTLRLCMRDHDHLHALAVVDPVAVAATDIGDHRVDRV